MSQKRSPGVTWSEVVARQKSISKSTDSEPASRNSPTKCHAKPLNAAKKVVSRLPEPKILRIQERYIAGQNQTAIAKAEGCDRETVSRIVKGSDMAEYAAQMREHLRGLVPDAIAAIQHGLRVDKSRLPRKTAQSSFT